VECGPVGTPSGGGEVFFDYQKHSRNGDIALKNLRREGKGTGRFLRKVSVKEKHKGRKDKESLKDSYSGTRESEARDHYSF